MIVTNITRPTKIQRICDYMAQGNSLTPGQARSRFRVNNMRATMSDLQEAMDRFGHRYSVVRETRNGRSYYRLRSATRR